MIPKYPEATSVTLELRPILHPLFAVLKDRVSEFTFANIYLFRNTYGYKISRISDSSYVLSGERDGKKFFLLPFGLPDREILSELFARYGYLKLATESLISGLAGNGYEITEDRNNFDYLYFREKLANLEGRKLHKKRNLVNAFVNNYSFLGKTLWSENVPDAIEVLEHWNKTHDAAASDYEATREALELVDQLEFHGSIVYVDGRPAGFTLGEELGAGSCFAIHFEKAKEQYKGIYQFMNKCFASLLPKKYEYINREQDLGDEGLRQAKESYKPAGFVKKYIVREIRPGN